jgi:DNA-binding transcriptional regulator YdaS (Cro superfamily)
MKVARLIGRHHATIVRWRRVPAEHAVAVSQASGLALHEIRPDVFPVPVAEESAA